MAWQNSTSPLACSIGLPISRTMMSASSSWRSACICPTLRISSARSATVVSVLQLACARWARPIASSSCSSLIVSYSLMVSPVAGLTTA